MTIVAKLTNLIKSCRFRGFSQLAYSYLYQKAYKYYAKRNDIVMRNLSVKEFKRKWNSLGRVWETISYRYFANYMDNLSDIVPESIGRTCIEYFLNPIPY